VCRYDKILVNEAAYVIPNQQLHMQPHLPRHTTILNCIILIIHNFNLNHKLQLKNVAANFFLSEMRAKYKQFVHYLYGVWAGTTKKTPEI